MTGDPDISQDYTQVGPTWLSVSWRQTTGRVGTGGQGNCLTGGNNCQGTFQGETVSGVASNVQHQIYVADPLASSPMVGSTLGTSSKSYPALGQTGPFTLWFRHTAVDKDHIVLLRDSVQSSGNRTKVIYCGNSPGSGAAALRNAFVNGCAEGP